MESGAIIPWDGCTSREQIQGVIWQMRAALERIVADAGPGRMDLPGAMDDWTVKDAIAHLTGWRWWSVARLEAAVRDEVPVPTWGDDLDEEREGDTDRINARFYAANRDLPVGEILRDSRATLDRLEAAVLALPEADLFASDRYPWLHGYPAAAIVTFSAEHLDEHVELIDALLARESQS